MTTFHDASCLTCGGLDRVWADGEAGFCSGCVEAGWSFAYRQGQKAVLTTFWRAVCEAKAAELDAEADQARERANALRAFARG